MSKNYIDWYEEHTQNNKRVMNSISQDFIWWIDLITDTTYCLSEEKYNRIFDAGCKELERCVKENDLHGAEAVFYKQGEGEISLFPILPLKLSCFNKNKPAIRIADYVCTRTAFLYAVKYKDIFNTANFEEDKNKIRLQGLTWNFGEKTLLYPELKWISELLENNKESNEILDLEVDVIKGGMVKIKQYYLETNNLPEIRGASLLLDMVNSEKMKEIVCSQHIRECLIYAGGGKMLGVLPEEEGGHLCEAMESLVENFTITAQSNFCSKKYTIKELNTSYKYIMNEMDVLLEERQGLRWDFRVEPQKRNSHLQEMEGAEFVYLQEENKYICDSCKHRYAKIKLKKEPNPKLCLSCLCKNLNGGSKSKQSSFKIYQEYIKRKYNEQVEEKEGKFNTLEEIGDSSSGFVGAIYGDANNMSMVVKKISSLNEMKYFSERTSDTVTEVVFEALYEHLQERPAFEIITVGGDDILIIVPGNKAYDIACSIGKNFDEKFKNQSEDIGKITMSLGVCVTHVRMPVQYTFDLAQQLLKSAKQMAWVEMKKNNAVGTIDWMIVENDVTGSSVLKYVRKEEPGKSQKTLRPYTFKQAKAIKTFIHALHNSEQQEDKKSFALQLNQSWYQHEEKEAELFYEYQIARNDTLKSICQTALRELAENFNGKVQGSNIILNERKYSPWLDAVELWDYVEEEQNGKG